MSRFHIFGCPTFLHVPSENRTKLEPTAERGIFVGYDETSKAFHVYFPTLRKVLVSGEVRSEEEQDYRKSRESMQGEQQVLTPQEALQVPPL